MTITNVLGHHRYRPIFDIALSGFEAKRPVTVADVTQKLGRSRSSIHTQVSRLESEGFVELVGDPNRTRTIIPTEKGIKERRQSLPKANIVDVPASHELEATVHPAACGLPSWADGNLEPLTINLLFNGFKSGDEIIHARGNSMVDVIDEALSIEDGDLVWVRPSTEPVEGVPVYVEYFNPSGEHECAIKYLEHDADAEIVTLKSSNPDYSDLALKADAIRKCSVVLGIRHYKATVTK